jgi:DNA repair protein RadC
VRGEAPDLAMAFAAMKEIPRHDRPREKLDRVGPTGLGDNELLAIVLASGSRRADALSLANQLLATVGGLRGLARASAADCRRVPGVGRARSAQILAALELGRRTLAMATGERPRLNSPQTLAAHLLPLYGTRPVEHFGIVMLDTKHRLIRTTVLSIGSLDTTIVHPREVFREAAAASAAAIVLFHNHPSGDPTPSADDLALTARLMDAGAVMGIGVLDHVILAESRYFSVAEAGGLPSQTWAAAQGKIERL